MQTAHLSLKHSISFPTSGTWPSHSAPRLLKDFKFQYYNIKHPSLIILPVINPKALHFPSPFRAI